MIEEEEADRPRRRGRLFWLALGLVVTLLFCVAPTALVVTLIRRSPDVPAPTGTTTVAAPQAAPSPLPGDPPEVVQAWLAERLAEALDAQARALLAGDETGFLAVTEPGSAAAADLKRQYRSLRELRVTRWRPELRELPVHLPATDEWRVLVTVAHCFVVPDCQPAPVVFGMRWRATGGQVRLVAVEPSLTGEDGPRPWEVSELSVAVGERTLVATTSDRRRELAALLAEAEKAADVADRYAVDGSPPDRYRIFYAGAEEWRLWYGGNRPAWTAGYAVAVGGNHYEVVLNADGIRDGLGELLRHELTHAAALPDRGYADNGSWWLVEGVAEYAASGAQPVARYHGRTEVGRVLKAGRWAGRLEAVEPGEDAADWEVAGSYGIGYLAVRHLADRFGEAALLNFFRAVVHDGEPVSEAARTAFGADWAVLHDECVSYVRSMAG